MELRHLRSLVAIADAGTFVSAAELLRVAQPALSRQMRDLARELKVELFAAGARRATLTAAGEASVRMARHVLRDTVQAVARARLSNSGLAGRCELLSGPLPLLSGFTGRLVARVKAKYPDITLVVHERSLIKWFEGLANGEADIGLGVHPPPGMPSLASETQYTDVVDIALLPPGHPLAKEEAVTLAQLAKYPHVAIGPTGAEPDTVARLLMSELRRRKLKLPDIVNVDSLESLLTYVRVHNRWTLMVRLMLTRTPQLVGVPIRDFRAPYRTARVWRRADTRPIVHTILRELRQMELEDREASPTPGTPGPRSPKAPEGAVPVRLDLRHLRSFVKVARHGTLGRAAETLEISQPALSRQMRDLEYDVGVPLLERGARGIELTPAGQVFLLDVTAVLGVADHLRREAQRAARGASRGCVLGVVPHPLVDHILSQALATLAARESGVRVAMRPVYTPMVASALEESEIDIGIGNIYSVPMPPTDGLIHQTLFDDEVSAALLPRDHPLAASPSLFAADLAEVPFLWPGRSLFPRYHDTVMQAFSRVGLRPRIEAEYDGLLTIWSLVAQGLGWTIGLESQLKEPPPGVRAVRLRDFRLSGGVEVIYRRDESRAAILSVIDAIAEAAQVSSHAQVAAPPGATVTDAFNALNP